MDISSRSSTNCRIAKVEFVPQTYSIPKRIMEKPPADSTKAETVESMPSDVPLSEVQQFDDHVTAKTWLVVFVRRTLF